MAFDVFLKIDNLEGECTDTKHVNWIELISFSHGLSQAGGSQRSDRGAAAGERVTHQDFTVVHMLDKASPKLALFCCQGKHMPTVTVELCRATGDKTKYMEYKMTDVIVSSVRPSGSAKSDEVIPIEEVGFNYGKIEWTYTETDHKTGKPGGAVPTFWSTIENQGG